MKTRIAIALALGCLVSSGTAQRGKQDIRMIILPVHNACGSKDEEATVQNALARAALLTAFRERGFEVVGSTQIVASLEQLNLDVSSSDKWTPDALRQLGERWKAKYVAGIKLSGVGAAEENGSRHAYASASGWLFDVKEGKFIVENAEGSGRNPLRPDAPTTDIKTLSAAVQQPFSEFLSKHPKRKPPKTEKGGG